MRTMWLFVVTKCTRTNLTFHSNGGEYFCTLNFNTGICLVQILINASSGSKCGRVSGDSSGGAGIESVAEDRDVWIYLSLLKLMIPVLCNPQWTCNSCSSSMWWLLACGWGKNMPGVHNVHYQEICSGSPAQGNDAYRHGRDSRFSSASLHTSGIQRTGGLQSFSSARFNGFERCALREHLKRGAFDLLEGHSTPSRFNCREWIKQLSKQM